MSRISMSLQQALAGKVPLQYSATPSQLLSLRTQHKNDKIVHPFFQMNDFTMISNSLNHHKTINSGLKVPVASQSGKMYVLTTVKAPINTNNVFSWNKQLNNDCFIADISKYKQVVNEYKKAEPDFEDGNELDIDQNLGSLLASDPLLESKINTVIARCPEKQLPALILSLNEFLHTNELNGQHYRETFLKTLCQRLLNCENIETPMPEFASFVNSTTNVPAPETLDICLLLLSQRGHLPEAKKTLFSLLSLKQIPSKEAFTEFIVKACDGATHPFKNTVYLKSIVAEHFNERILVALLSACWKLQDMELLFAFAEAHGKQQVLRNCYKDIVNKLITIAKSFAGAKPHNRKAGFYLIDLLHRLNTPFDQETTIKIVGSLVYHGKFSVAVKYLDSVSLTVSQIDDLINVVHATRSTEPVVPLLEEQFVQYLYGKRQFAV